MQIDHQALLQTFLAEAEEQLNAIEETLLNLENRPDDEQTLQGLFRAAHTFKGNASLCGLNRLAELAHILEDALDGFRNRTLTVSEEWVTLLLQAVDLFRQLIPMAMGGKEVLSPAHEEFFRKISEKAGEGKGAAQAAPIPMEPKESGEDRFRLEGHAQTLRIDVRKLDRMLALSGEIAIGRGRIGQVLRAGGATAVADALDIHEEIEQLHSQLQEEVMSARMVPVAPILRQYLRTLRDLARELGKVVRLHIEGEGVELDTRIIEGIRAALNHIIRNSIDHGIESPEVRIKKGKDPCGCITLKVFREGGNVVIQVADDGAGFSKSKICDRASALGIDTSQMTEKELHQLVFQPGFSTAEKVTELSGRGVGMDVVQKSIDVLRGSLSVDTVEDQGTTVSLRLPLTLAIIDGFSVRAGEETYVFPLELVLECLELPAEERARNAGYGIINLRGQVLPYIRLRKLFHLKNGDAAPERENVVVVRHDGGKAGLAVDEIHGGSQVVIKPLGRMFDSVPGLAGSTILGDGRVGLILDVPGLLRRVLASEVRPTS